MGFSYVSSSFAKNDSSASASTITINTAVAAQADDIILAVVSNDNSGSLSSISSTNTTWSRITTFHHTGNTQNFELWGGVLTGNLSSGSTITATFSADVPYRVIQIAHFRSDNGIDSTPYNTYNSVVYGSGSNPTSVDGFSVSVTPTGTNALTAVEIIEVEDEGVNTNDLSPQSGFTQIIKDMFLGEIGPYLWAYKTGISAGTQNITATYSVSSTYGSSLAVVILEGGGSAATAVPVFLNQYRQRS